MINNRLKHSITVRQLRNNHLMPHSSLTGHQLKVQLDADLKTFSLIFFPAAGLSNLNTRSSIQNVVFAILSNQMGYFCLQATLIWTECFHLEILRWMNRCHISHLTWPTTCQENQQPMIEVMRSSVILRMSEFNMLLFNIHVRT